MAMPRKLSKEQVDVVCKKYKNGKNSYELGEEYDVSDSTIRDYLEKRGIDRRGRSESHRWYNLNQSVFDEINEESAYWIGIMMADGCISYREGENPHVRLCLSEKDKTHVEKFKNFLETDKPIYESYSNCEIDVISKRMVNCLEDFGVVPNKTGSEEVKGKLKDNCHFWRGVVDGDGSMGIYNKNPQLTLCGSKPLMLQFKNFVNGFCNTKATVIDKDGYYKYTLGGKHLVSKVIEKLYSDATIYLDRKKKIADEILDEYK